MGMEMKLRKCIVRFSLILSGMGRFRMAEQKKKKRWRCESCFWIDP